jgi:hypothetical protein
MGEQKKHNAIPITAKAKRSSKGCSSAPLKQTEPGKKSWANVLGHGALDIAGLVPGFGEIADGANAAWYTAEGDYKNAALSAAAMIPFAGWAATATKLGMKGNKALKVAKNVDKAANSKVGKFLQLNKPTKLGKYDRMAGVAMDGVFGSDGSSEQQSKPTNSKKEVTNSSTKTSAKSESSASSNWKKASKATGGNLSSLVKTRNSAKKGSPEYAKAQNAINKAYGSKKRH